MFTNKAKSVKEYLAALPAEKRAVAEEVVALVRKNLPAGYQEGIGWGAISWSVPLDVLPDTYNGEPLCYTAFAANKSGFSLYLMTVYGDTKLESAFKAAYKKAGKKLDMGKSCLRFKTMDDLVLPAVKSAIKAQPMKAYVARFKAIRKTTKAGK
jgi:hypothetical protein